MKTSIKDELRIVSGAIEYHMNEGNKQDVRELTLEQRDMAKTLRNHKSRQTKNRKERSSNMPKSRVPHVINQCMTIAGMIDVLASQACVYEGEHVVQIETNEKDLEFLERSFDTEDASTLWAAKEFAEGQVTHRQMLDRMRELEQNRFSNSYFIDSAKEAEWTLYFDTEEGRVVIVDSNDCPKTHI